MGGVHTCSVIRKKFEAEILQATDVRHPNFVAKFRELHVPSAEEVWWKLSCPGHRASCHALQRFRCVGTVELAEVRFHKVRAQHVDGFVCVLGVDGSGVQHSKDLLPRRTVPSVLLPTLAIHGKTLLPDPTFAGAPQPTLKPPEILSCVHLFIALDIRQQMLAQPSPLGKFVLIRASH